MAERFKRVGFIDHGPRGHNSGQEGLIFQAAADSPLKIYRDNGRNASTPIRTYDEFTDLKNTPIRSIKQVHALDQGAGILIATPDRSGSLMLRCDSEYGKTTDEIVTNYNAGGYRPLKLDFVTPLEKFSQYRTDHNPNVINLVGIGGEAGNAVFNAHYDRREGEAVKLNNNNMHKYKSGVVFTAGATSKNGYAIVGDEEGKVRIFEDIKANGRALKTLEQHTGEPVVGIDVSYGAKRVGDELHTGRHIVWNNSYQVFIVRFDEGESSYQSTPKDMVYAIELRLRPSHAQEVGEDLDYCGVKFDRGPAGPLSSDVIENSVITFTDRFAITWKMRDIERAFDKLDAILDSGKQPDSAPYVESANVAQTSARVIDHIPLVGAGSRAHTDIASLAQGIEQVNI
eukprot:TRINITY_DN7122_c0_g1_i1.p1 TRINITY_DN7122_c0_g1~~TRINITY_DN7122_c0_g1_i1.p1  ORF type:complete len:399 (+),score=100.23 TRINITY_DN7122_c0_g1_i1:13-1209(+)